jgi:hypothetical protein
MSTNRHRVNYRRKLARPLILRDGNTLITLRDAANILLYAFGSTDTRSGTLDHASRQLLAAAESGKGADIAAATDEIETLLRGRQLL